MKTVFVIRNQFGHYLGRNGEWLDGSHVPGLYRTEHRDAAVNELVEVNLRDFDLRGEIIALEAEDGEYPVVEVLNPVVATAPEAETTESSAGESETSGRAPTLSLVLLTRSRTHMMRIGLFLLTNIAVLALANITLGLLGFNSIMAQNGVGLNLQALLVFCAVFGMSGSIISLLMSKWMAKRATGTRLITEPRTEGERWLVQTVAQLAEQEGIGMPEVGVFPSDASNAFATGWNRNAALVAVSSGLLSRFDRNEIRAVLAHEIGHVANGDMITLSLIQGVVNTFVMFFARIIGHTVDKVVFKTERGLGLGYYIVTFVAEIVLGLLASMIVMWFSRRREFRADHAGARLAGKGAMIAALQRLQAEQDLPKEMPATLTAFGISGDVKHGLAALLRTHPSLEDRIQALRDSA